MLVPCNRARRAKPRSARRVTGRRIRSLSAGSSSPTRSRFVSSGRTPTTPSRSPGNGRSGEACACSSRCAAGSRRIRRAVRSKKACGRSWCSARVSTLSPIASSATPICGSSSSIIRRPKPRSDAGSLRRKSPSLAHVSYVAHDFEGGSMIGALKAAGLDPDRRTFVIWLGVTPYLTEEALFATLGELARFPGGAEVVFDYANPPRRNRRRATRDFHREMAERVAASGEPFRCYLDSAELHARARGLGFCRHRGSRSSGARRALSAGLSGPSAARAGRPRRQDGDEVTVCGHVAAATLSCRSRSYSALSTASASGSPRSLRCTR